MWLRVVEQPGARVFAVLSMVEAGSRALIAGVLPLEAYALLHSAQNISIAYTVVGGLAFATSFLLPLAMRAIRRKWIFTIGVGFMVAAPLLMALSAAVPFLLALLLRGLAVVCVNIALNLYILDYIRRKEFVTAEPLRLAYLGVAWFIGPALGIWLYKHFGILSVAVPSAGFAVAALAFFWFLRLRDNPAVAPARTRRQPMPWQYIRRYLAQPRLRLAWIIPFGRSTYWTTFFVYPAVYIVQRGGDETTVAVMLAGGQALLLISPLFGRAGARFGIRRIVIGAALLTGAVSLLVGLLQPGPWGAAALFVVAAIGSTALDALGNIPFLRAVHHYERAEMTSVFRTYIEASQLLPSAVYALVLVFLPLPYVFVVLAAVLFGTAWFARYLPKSL
jgi:predicted MFS family arabinose efflux permease